MVKLSDKEVAKAIEEERVIVDLPRNAHSVFHFKIKETSADMLKAMKEPPKKRCSDIREVDENGEVSFNKGFSEALWKYIKLNENHIELSDPDFDCAAQVEIKDNGLTITTAWSGYKYEIDDDKEGSGAWVTFYGPVNALGQQNLFPDWTYEAGTLEGKFVNSDTNEDLTGYMDMYHFGIMRAAKNEKTIKDTYEYECKGNSQDKYGFWVNRQFNNEIVFLPKHVPVQEYKNTKAQEAFENGEKKYISERRKEDVKKRIEKIKGKMSDVVKADKLAEKAIKGKISQAFQSSRSYSD